MPSYKSISEENHKRNAALNDQNYDPFTGQRCVGDRFVLKLDPQAHIYTPETARSEDVVKAIVKHGSVKGAAHVNRIEEWVVLRDFSIVRFKHDFEFWAISCVRIQDKQSKKMVPFKLHLAQRILLEELERMRVAGKPIRVILLKARQWGGSTLVQIYMAWIQLFHEVGWHSAIVADVEDQARNIRSMYSKLAGNYPREVSTITITPFEGSSKNKYLIERGCIMSIGSAQQPDSLRSFDLAMLHLSEVGLWKQTAGKSPEDLVQALIGALARGRNTLLVEESTAKGVGNYFHRRWQASVNGQNNSVPVFIPWHKIDMYRLTKKEINDNYGNYEKFVESWTEYERFLWSEGATIEGIAWYRWQLDEYDGDSWRMQSEFPTTAQEAFQSTGRRVFHPAYVLNLRKHTRDPVAIGNLEGDGQTGPGSLQNIRFVPSKNGHLWIWKFPEDIEPPRPVRNMTCGFADIGGRTKTADKSTLKIFNRYWMMEGGLPEVVAEYRGNLDQDIFAWDAVRLCKWYFNALLAVEINSLRTKHSDTEGEHGYTILDEIKEHYDYLFYRTQPGSIVDRAPTRILGFHTGKGTKEMIVNRLNAAARDTEYIERSSRTCDEMDSYEIKPDGTMGAVEGAKDDLVISTAGGVWLATSYMSHPKMIRSGTGKRLRQRKTEAVI